MTFNLTIELGNAAMQDASDIAAALQRVARDVKVCSEIVNEANEDGEEVAQPCDEVPIRDMNGNKVGTWRITE